MAYPFLKWPGGKRALMPEIAARAPARIERYAELFTGGGAAFFGLRDRIASGVLADVNGELVSAYVAVKHCTEELIGMLEGHQAAHADPAYYYIMREEVPADSVAAAARFIYLNRTCFNGLHRVNRAGKFNVPRGSYKNPRICDADNLRAVASALAGVDLMHGDFTEIGTALEPGPGTFIYADPPYDGTWTGYAAGGFGAADQERLRDRAAEWAGAGATVLLSNSDTPYIRDLYSGPCFRVERVEAPRRISGKAKGRGAVHEVLITAEGGA